jgi:uncharacterized protein (DUF1697 family)
MSTSHRYVALLRGINVGTANQIAMSDLRAVFVSLGYTEVETLLRSGNVVFTATRSLGPAATSALEDELKSVTGVGARMLLVAADRFHAIAEANPLLPVADNPSLMVITFLPESPPATLEVPSDLEPELLVVGPDAIYQWCPLGVSKSKVPLSWFRALGPTATTRNQRTVDKLRGLLG